MILWFFSESSMFSRYRLNKDIPVPIGLLATLPGTDKVAVILMAAIANPYAINLSDFRFGVRHKTPLLD
jgi:hypothetical protein